jgi:hypothetical protein
MNERLLCLVAIDSDLIYLLIVTRTAAANAEASTRPNQVISHVFPDLANSWDRICWPSHVQPKKISVLADKLVSQFLHRSKPPMVS